MKGNKLCYETNASNSDRSKNFNCIYVSSTDEK